MSGLQPPRRGGHAPAVETAAKNVGEEDRPKKFR